MTQVAPTSLRHHVTCDVTTSGRRRGDTAYQALEKRFRADLSRRLRRLRVRLEDSRGRAPTTAERGGPEEMPTIAAKPPTGAWMMPQPSRRRSASYQSVTQAVNPLYTIPSPRAASSSVPPRSRRAVPGLGDSSASLSSDEPEVGPRSRDSVTSSASDLLGVCNVVKTESDSDLSPTGGDVTTRPETSRQRMFNTRGRIRVDAEGRGELYGLRAASMERRDDRDAVVGRTKHRISPVVRPEVAGRADVCQRMRDDTSTSGVLRR